MGILIPLVIVILGCIIYYSKIKVHICYRRKSNNDYGEVKVRALGGLIHYRLAIPNIDFENMDKGVKVESKKNTEKEKEKDTFINKQKIENWYEHYEELLYHVKHFQESMRWFMARVRCDNWIWNTVIGTGDAAEAGVLTGVVWGVKANILGFISHYIQWNNKPELGVTPSFQHAVLDTSFEAKFSFVLGDAIRFFVVLWFRFKKGNKKSHIISTQRMSNM
ncbi:DUF2953 domain-containing protein [Shimazuella kribbensis]|uniref:DUF2953 domain-containing protein n=1 Tax=Shimazuella kribbensis TaxID=139808 RepID=UPI00048AC583|nr:DUF2953 domain-containing protein [Shimazuella kribbensis]